MNKIKGEMIIRSGKATAQRGHRYPLTTRGIKRRGQRLIAVTPIAIKIIAN